MSYEIIITSKGHCYRKKNLIIKLEITSSCPVLSGVNNTCQMIYTNIVWLIFN